MTDEFSKALDDLFDHTVMHVLRKGDVDQHERYCIARARVVAEYERVCAAFDVKQQRLIEVLGQVERLTAELAAERQRAEGYAELIYAVARKFPGETRHQTALRYITQAENCSDDVANARAALEPKP